MDDEYREATFDGEDFERWWLKGMSRQDRFLPPYVDELYGNCVYLAQAEGLEMTQTESELQGLIADWAADWNARIDDEEDKGI